MPCCWNGWTARPTERRLRPCWSSEPGCTWRAPRAKAPRLRSCSRWVVRLLPEDALGLRADLAEKAGDTIDAIACWQRVRSLRKDDRAAREEVDKRLAAVVVRPTVSTETARAMLEELHAANPADVALAESLFAVYGRLPDLQERDRAWADLLKASAWAASFLSCALASGAGRSGRAERKRSLGRAGVGACECARQRSPGSRRPAHRTGATFCGAGPA